MYAFVSVSIKHVSVTFCLRANTDTPIIRTLWHVRIGVRIVFSKKLNIFGPILFPEPAFPLTSGRETQRSWHLLAQTSRIAASRDEIVIGSIFKSRMLLYNEKRIEVEVGKLKIKFRIVLGLRPHKATK